MRLLYLNIRGLSTRTMEPLSTPSYLRCVKHRGW
jgi:hypothetical protein